jgi:pilus assembly protein CpaE
MEVTAASQVTLQAGAQDTTEAMDTSRVQATTSGWDTGSGQDLIRAQDSPGIHDTSRTNDAITGWDTTRAPDSTSAQNTPSLWDTTRAHAVTTAQDTKRFVALVMPRGALRDATLYALSELNAQVAYDHENVSNWAGLDTVLEQAGIDVLLFDLTCLPEPELTRTITEIKARTPHVKVIAAYPYDDSARILMAMRAGVNDFVHSQIAPALAAALRRMPQVRVPAPAPQRRGKVIGFVSAKGGCGATTVACHVAVDLRRRTGKEVLLAEFDSVAGPLNFLMKTQGQYSLGDALDNISRLDASFWPALIAPSASGVSVLPAPNKLMPGDCEVDRVLRVVRFMRTQHDWCVLDFGRGVNPLLAAAAEELDELFVITTIDIPSLHMAKSMLRALPVALERVPLRLVLNRTQKALEVSVDEIQRIFGRPVYATIPDDFETLYMAYSSGALLRPDTRLGACFTRMAMQLTGETVKLKSKKFFLW